MRVLKKKYFLVLVSVLFLVLAFSIIPSNNKTIGSKNKDNYIANFTIKDNYDLSTNNSIDPTKWVAVDNLGRSVSNSGETYTNGVTNTSKTVGTSTNDSKEVGLFYHNWGNVARHGSPYPITVPTARQTIKNQGLDATLHSSWGAYNMSLWWGEPVYGFYNPLDKYVIRKQMELIADAGVDFIALDYTNWHDPVSNEDPYDNPLDDSVFPDELEALFEVLERAKADGIEVPKVTFVLPHLALDKNSDGCKCSSGGSNCKEMQQCINYNEHTKVMVQWLYDNVYKTSKRDYVLKGGDGKPILLAQRPSPSTWTPDSKYATVISESTFHWRFIGNQYETADYNTSGYDWSWIDKYPQTKYIYNTSTKTTNLIPVSPAQHTDSNSDTGVITMDSYDTYGKDVLGRSNAIGDDYTYSFKYRGKNYNVTRYFQLVNGTGVGTLYGRNFQQQWDYALNVDPQYVFVTAWNEYLVGLSSHEDGKVKFIDTYDDEYSRDVEPVKGPLKDSYYYQLVSNVRRFKGANGQETQNTSKTINIYGDPNQWSDSKLLDYNSYTNKTAPERNVNNNKWGYNYIDSTNPNNLLKSDGVKNDIRTTKVSYDASNIYFYVETVNKITDISKLRLLIDTLDSRTSTSTANWNEFEYVLNRTGATSSTLKLERVSSGCRRDDLPSESNTTCQYTKQGDVNYQIVSNTLQVSIPRSLLGLTSTNINFNYKWADNNLGNLEKMYDIMSIYTDGDAAPGGRFAFKFSGSKAYQEPTQYTISYNSNGGEGTISSQNGELYTKITLKNNTFTNGSLVFENWNTKADGTGDTYDENQTILITGNMTLYAMWSRTGYTINNYEVDEVNSYINKIMVNTELSDFTSNITLGSGYGVDVDTKTVNNKELLYTGGKTRITKNSDLYREYTNIVVGDVNGDAGINSADLLRIRQHLLGTNTLKGAYFISSDVNYDKSVNSADLLRVRQHLLGTKYIE